MKKIFCFLALSLALILSGCVARTYSIAKDRVDQDLTAGNRGYILGKAPVSGTDVIRKENRTVRVFEVELGKPYAAKQAAVPVSTQSENVKSTSEVSSAETDVESAAAAPIISSAAGQKYTVGKNDTLQKISQKFYGTTKNWTKIYNANRDVLSGPDKVYPGQTLNIPDISEAKTPAEKLK